MKKIRDYNHFYNPLETNQAEMSLQQPWRRKRLGTAKLSSLEWKVEKSDGLCLLQHLRQRRLEPKDLLGKQLVNQLIARYLSGIMAYRQIQRLQTGD